MASYTPCPDVRFFLRLNITSIIDRPLIPLEIQSSIAWSVLFACILLSNGLIFGLIMSKRLFRDARNDILASLCLANILYSFAYILPIKMMVIGNSLDPFRNGYCQLGSSVILFAFICIINFHICSIGLENLIAITKPALHQFMTIEHRVNSIIIIVCITWCLPIFFAFFPLIIGWWRLCPYFCSISITRSGNLRQQLVAWHMSWSFLTFLLPTCVTIILYSRIAYVVIKSGKSWKDNSIESSYNHVNRIIVAVAVIVGIYLLLQTPYNIFQIINIVTPQAINRSSKFVIREWLAYVASWNSVTSPLIFACYHRILRRGMVEVIRCKCFNSKEEASPDHSTNAMAMRTHYYD